MKIIFFGTAEFACPILERLVKEGHKISVVTQSDKPKGRHLLVKSPPVKILAQQLNLDVLQPNNLNDTAFIEQLKNINADVFVVVSFGKILKKCILELPKKMCINIHASLLPKYRGAAPINWAIANGEKETGITIIKMNEAMDAGEIIGQEKIGISQEDNAVTISSKLSILGAQCLIKVLKLLEANNFVLVPQDNKQASYAPKIKKSDGLINWEEPAGKIYNKMRAFLPWPGSFTYWDKKLLKIIAAKVIPLEKDISNKPAVILNASREGILAAAGKDGFLIQELQLAGKQSMKAAEFLSGYKIHRGQKLGL